MTEKDLKKRINQFALRIIRLYEALPKSRSADVIGKQLLRCASSVGANYRASCRAKSSADFIAEIETLSDPLPSGSSVRLEE